MKILNKLNIILGANSKIKNVILISLLLTSITIITLFSVPVIACQSVGTYESDYITPKIIFMQGEIVYGKETYTQDIHLRLRIRDPSNNVIFTSDPIFGKEVLCSYQLNDSATIGEWNIQVGTYKEGEWIWLTRPGDVAYFDVIEPPKFILDIKITGSGIVTINPNQEEYVNGTVVTLTAEPSSGWKFDHWSGNLSGSSNPESITMDSNKSVNAYFIQKKIEGGGNGGGSPVNKNIGEDQENIPPTAHVVEIYEGFVDSEILFNGSLSYDIDGYITEYHWDFGDGTSDEGETVYHSYSNAGVYTVYLNVTDNDRAINQSIISVVVDHPNRSPSIPEINGPIEGEKGIEYTYTVVSTDEDNDDIKYIIDWGDGKIDESEFLASGTIFMIKHKWSSTGSFVIKADANDNQAISSSELTIIIEEPVPEEFNILLIFLALLAIILLILAFVFIKRSKNKK